MRSPLSRAGFTLIELLIVVAIIAILAAIAVPNFLEAQTRSKVSRVKTDMRTLSVGMEAYAVDNNRYPIPADAEGRYLASPLTATSVSPFETRVPVLLTTPVAYLSSRPTDPFAKPQPRESPLYHAVTEGYVDIRQNYAPTQNWKNAYRNFFRDIRNQDPPSAIRYFFVSFGPDHDHDADVPHAAGGGPSVPHVHGSGALYDPTNGTVSSGDILYFGPGLGFWN